MLIKFVPQVKIIFKTLAVVGLVIMFTYLPARSQMLNELSDVQNAIFHLSPRNHEFTAETDKADQYIDEDQADFFIAAGKPDMELEADGNYPYSVVDHRIRDEDLKMGSEDAVYLSRDNIYQKEYHSHRRPPNFFIDNSYKNKYRHKFEETRHEKEHNNRLNPPDFFIDSTETTEPFNHQRVTTTYWQLHDYEVEGNEVLHRSVTPGEDCIRGYMVGGYALSRGRVSVWVSETRGPAECQVTEREQPKAEPKPAGRCDCSED